MAIVQDTDGYSTFIISKDANIPDITLQSFKSFIDLLNDTDLAYSLINHAGMVTSPEVQGVFVKKQNNKLGIILGQEFNPIVYRGQYNDYPFMPSSQRYELFDGNERIRHSIEWIKKNEFIRLILNTPYYKRTREFKVLDCNYEFDMEAVAKQYNYVSDYIDVTRNIMIAYFFAYTYWNKDENQLLPIENFENYSPMLYVGSLRDLYYKAPYSVENICFQTMLRAKAQQTMSLNVSTNRDYIKSLFKKIELPKNPVIAKNVFEQFKGGELLFPNDYATRCAAQIKNFRTLQEDLVVKYCEQTATDEEWLRGEYKKLNYELINQIWDIPEQARSMINREIDEYILPYLNTGFLLRGIRK